VFVPSYRSGAETTEKFEPRRNGALSPFLRLVFSVPSALPVFSLSAAYEADDLDLIPLAHDGVVVLLTLDDDHVVLDGDDAGIDVQPGEQRADRDGTRDLVRLAVQSYRQTRILPAQSSTPVIANGRSRPCSLRSPSLLDRRGPLHPGWLAALRSHFAARSASLALTISSSSYLASSSPVTENGRSKSFSLRSPSFTRCATAGGFGAGAATAAAMTRR